VQLDTEALARVHPGSVQVDSRKVGRVVDSKSCRHPLATSAKVGQSSASVVATLHRCQIYRWLVRGTLGGPGKPTSEGWRSDVVSSPSSLLSIRLQVVGDGRLGSTSQIVPVLRIT